MLVCAAFWLCNRISIAKSGLNRCKNRQPSFFNIIHFCGMHKVLIMPVGAMLYMGSGNAQQATSSEFAPLLRYITIAEPINDTSFTTALGIALRYNKTNNQVDSVYLPCPPGHPCSSLSTRMIASMQKIANTSQIDWKKQARPFAIRKVTFLLPVFVKVTGANAHDFSVATRIFWNHIWMPLYAGNPWPPHGLVLLTPQFLFTGIPRPLTHF